MKSLLLSILVLCLRLHQSYGNSLSKLELVYPKDLIYKVEEEQNGTVLTITAPESEEPTLREIIYYHLVEKPLGSTESDDNDSESDIPEFDTTGRVFTNAQQGPQYNENTADVLDRTITTNPENKPKTSIPKEENYYGEDKIDKRKDAVDLIEENDLEDITGNEEHKIEQKSSIKDVTNEEISDQKRLKRALSSGTKLPKNYLFKKFYDKASSEDHAQDDNKPSSGLRGTYGMVLNNGDGVVWNALKNAGYSFNVGSDSEESGSDSSGSTSDESSSSESSSESDESEENYTVETNLSETIDSSNSNESESSNKSEENHNTEEFNENNGIENVGYSQENVDNGFYIDSNHIGQYSQENIINNGFNNNIEEATSGLNNVETDQIDFGNNNFRIDSILQNLDDIIDNNPSINSHTNHALDIVHDILEDKNYTPEVIVQTHPNKPILNILKGLFTNIIQNNFTINNAGENEPYLIGNKDEVDTDKETTKSELEKGEIENTTPVIHIAKEKEVNKEAPELNPTTKNNEKQKVESSTENSSLEDNQLTTTTYIDTTISFTTGNTIFNNDKDITTETTTIDLSAEKDVSNKDNNNLDNRVNVTSQESKTNEPNNIGQAKKHHIDSGTDNNIDFMLEFLNNEKFWKFIGDLVKKHIDKIVQNTESLIKREVEHQVKNYLRKHKNKPYITHNKDEIPINKDKDIANDESDNHHLSKNKGHTHQENHKATNIYNFYGHNPDQIINSIKPILNKDGSLNIFNFGPDSNYKDNNLNKNKDTIDKKDDATDSTNETKPNEANITTEQSLDDIIPPTTEKIPSQNHSHIIVTTQTPVTIQSSESESSGDIEHTTPPIKDSTEINHTKSTESEKVTATTESHINKESTEKYISTSELPTESTTKSEKYTTEMSTTKAHTESSTKNELTTEETTIKSTTKSTTEMHELVTTEATSESTTKSDESKPTEVTTDSTKVTTEVE